MRNRFGSVATSLLYVVSTTTLIAASANAGTQQDVDFERQIVGLLGKLGCNAGACHGSFQGKGGLFLSLFSYAPEKDYKSLVRDSFGRRVNLTRPEDSLIILKATGVVPHGGGQRVKPGSKEHEMLLGWIRQGAKWTPGTGSITGMKLTPGAAKLLPGEKIDLKVEATYADGSTADVTYLTEFKIQDDSILAIADGKTLSARQPGDTSVVANYLGQVASGRYYQPWPEVKQDSAKVAASPSHPIDRIIQERLDRLNLVASGKSEDIEFLRRVTLDTIGRQPTPEEIEKFVADGSSDKREKTIDALLANPMHAAVWATKFSDWTLNSLNAMENRQDFGRNLQPKWSKMWWDWFKVRIARNEPYDKIVNGILTATSREEKKPEEWLKGWLDLNATAASSFDSKYPERDTNDLFWRRQNFTKEQMIELVASSFLGLQIQCAQCHKHPFDRWTQADYRSFENIVVPIRFDGNSPDSRQILKAEADKRREGVEDDLRRRQIQPHREVYVEKGRTNYLRHPDTNEPLPVKPPGGPVFMEASRQMQADDFRDELVGWMKEPGNPYFASNFVNRVWAHYLGVGVVNPVDNFAVGNPPTNPELLKALADKFIELNFDIKAFEKYVLMTDAYQRSSRPSVNNESDTLHFARFLPHPLMAEVAADVLADALMFRPDPRTMTDIPPNARAIEIPGNTVNQRDLAFQLRIFGRPPRSVSCECERAADPALPQSLFLAGDDYVVRGIELGPWADWAMDDEWPDEDLIQMAFLKTLARKPTEKEYAAARERIAGKKGKDRVEAVSDVVWALVNTREFLLNH